MMKGLLALAFGLVLFSGESNAVRRCKYYAQDLDPGHDITKVGVQWMEDCCQTCLSNPTCHGFTHYQGNCWLKYNGAPLVGGPAGVGSAVIEDVPEDQIAREAATTKTCTRLENTELDPGHDLRMVAAIYSFDACCDSCKVDYACKAVVFYQNQCWLKYNEGPTSYKAGLVAGVIQAAAPPPTPTRPPAPATDCPFRFFPGGSVQTVQGFDITPGRDITVRPSLDFSQCFQNCASCQGCVAFVFDPNQGKCFLKDSNNAMPSNDMSLMVGIIAM